MEFVSVSVDSKLNMDVQNGNISDAIPVVTNVKSSGVSPEPQFSGKELVFVDSEFNIDVQNGKIIDAIPVETHVQNYTISPELQLSRKEPVSIFADSEFNIDVQNGKTAYAIPVISNCIWFSIGYAAEYNIVIPSWLVDNNRFASKIRTSGECNPKHIN
ncbi:hypothetical protein Tco_1087537 [Tanacetum coccineum]